MFFRVSVVGGDKAYFVILEENLLDGGHIVFSADAADVAADGLQGGAENDNVPVVEVWFHAVASNKTAEGVGIGKAGDGEVMLPHTDWESGVVVSELISSGNFKDGDARGGGALWSHSIRGVEFSASRLKFLKQFLGKWSPSIPSKMPDKPLACSVIEKHCVGDFIEALFGGKRTPMNIVSDLCRTYPRTTAQFLHRNALFVQNSA